MNEFPSHRLYITECPRDAMQGIGEFIPTELKSKYLNQLLKVGFDTLDFGSFVSPKAVPQLADTAEVLNRLDLEDSSTRLLAIVANQRGADEAVKFSQISYLGYPFSISETFQQRNTRKSISESFELVKSIQDLCLANNKQLRIYISMAFGNPYGDAWDGEIVEEWVAKMHEIGIRSLALADTVGSADAQLIHAVFAKKMDTYPHMEIGAHFHAHPSDRIMKVKAAWDNGCRVFDTAIQGFGGCPFAEDDLIGNIATESLLEFATTNSISHNLDIEALGEAQKISLEIFDQYH